MAVIVSDLDDFAAEQVTRGPALVCHVKREPNTEKVLTPALCGDRYGFGVVRAEGEPVGEAWPYTEYCVVCKDLQHGDEDSPEQSAEWL